MAEVIESEFCLRFLGTGSANARHLGNSSAVLERAGEPVLLIDCGFTVPQRYEELYGVLPTALFLTHGHLDHIGGLEGLFYRSLAHVSAPRAQRALTRLYVPIELVPLVHRRIADQPNTLAEGGTNWWDLFQLIPVSERFWHAGLRFQVGEARHHYPGFAYGLGLPGVFYFTGDTRPIPEVLTKFASHGEPVFHDCSLIANPSHTGLEDLVREYHTEQRERMVLYHLGSPEEQDRVAARGFRVARDGEAFGLGHLIVPAADAAGAAGHAGTTGRTVDDGPLAHDPSPRQVVGDGSG